MAEGQIDEASTSRFVRTPSWNLHVNDAGQGVPLVMLHGSGPGATGWSNFQSNIAPLAERFRVLAVDMPGWGRSDVVSDPAKRDHVGALLELLDALDLERVALMGNSLGAMTSLIFAVEHPERVSHLVLMGAPAPGPAFFAPAAPSRGLEILFTTYQDPSPANFKELVRVMTFDERFATDELAAERSRAALEQPDHLTTFMPGLGTLMAPFPAVGLRLGEIAAPTLLVHGRDDRTVGVENSLKLVSVIPDSRLVVINRCGHWAQLEHADEFNRLVREFLLNH